MNTIQYISLFIVFVLLLIAIFGSLLRGKTTKHSLQLLLNYDDDDFYQDDGLGVGD